LSDTREACALAVEPTLADAIYLDHMATSGSEYLRRRLLKFEGAIAEHAHEFPGALDGYAARRQAELHFSLICAVAEEINLVPIGVEAVEADEADVAADVPGVREIDDFTQALVQRNSFVHLRPERPRAETWSSPDGSWQGKPIQALYTSPGDADWPGGWNLLSQMLPSMYPTVPATIYAATGSYRSRVIASADDWCDFILNYPSPGTSSAIGVDWNLVRSDYDCVMISAAAILGCDQLPLVRNGVRFRPVVWTVPTTLWLTTACLDRVAGTRPSGSSL
jgi:hypothetical protein